MIPYWFPLTGSYVLSVLVIWLVLFLKRKRKERRIKHPSFAKTSDRSDAPLDQLPQEMLETIFNLLDAKEISICAAVSKYWNFFIFSRGIKESIFDEELARLKPSLEELQLVTGKIVNSKYLVNRTYQANYPKSWLVQDTRRWKVYEFNRWDHALPVLDSLKKMEAARLAIRVRARAVKDSECHWTFETKENSWIKIKIKKLENSADPSPYYPIEEIFSLGEEYDFILNGRWIQSDQRPYVIVRVMHHVIYNVRPVDPPKVMVFDRLPHLSHILTFLGFLLVLFLFLDNLAFRWLAEQIYCANSLIDDELVVECTKDINFASALMYFSMLFRKLGAVIFTSRKLRRKNKLATENLRYSISLLILTVAVAPICLYFFPLYRWWLLHFLDRFCMPYEFKLAWAQRTWANTKYRRFYLMCTIVPIMALLCLISPWMVVASFDMNSYLIHVGFVLLTAAYEGYLLHCIFQAFAPDAFVPSPRMKKVVNWPLTVKWWFFIMLVGLPLSPRNYCLSYLEF